MSNAPQSSNRLPLIIALVTIVIAGGAIFWRKVVRDHVLPKNFGIVEEGEIYRSGQLTPRMLRKTVEEREIRTIIDLSHQEGSPISEREQDVADELGVRRFTFSLRGDGRGDPKDYAEVLRLMTAEENQPVLVHCAAGAQRTGVAVVLYRTLVQNEDIASVYPETFEFGHQDDEWIMLAYLADHIEAIRQAYLRPGDVTPEDVAASKPAEEAPAADDS